MSLISPSSTLGLQRDSTIRPSAIVDVRWYLGRPGRRARRLRRRPHPRRDLRRPRHGPARARGPGRHPLPDPAVFAGATGRRSGSARSTRSSPTTTSAAGSRRGCGGCSTTWATRRRAVLDGGFAAWVAGGPGRRPTSPSGRPRASELRGSLDQGRSIGTSRRPRLGDVLLLDARGAPRYRGEIEPIDPVAGHIPTARQRPDRRQPRPRRPVPRRRASCRARFEALGAGGSDGRSSPRAAAASPRATTRWRCASPACPIRSSTPARTATGARPATRSPPARNPERRPAPSHAAAPGSRRVTATPGSP